MTSGTGTCSVKYDQAGSANYNAAPQVTESVTRPEGEPDDQRHDARAGDRGLQHELHGRGDGARRRGHVLELGCLLEHRRHVHDDERHRHLLGQLRPGRQRELQRRAAGRRDRQRAEGRPDDHVTHARAGVGGLNSSFSVAATAPGGAVSFSSCGACSNTGATFTMTSGTGTCSVKYDQAGGANYNAAPQVTESVTATKANQTITVTLHAPATAVFGTSFSVAASGGGSGNAVTFSSCRRVLEHAARRSR